MQSICQADQGRCTLSRIATDGKAMTTDIKLDQQGGNWLVLEGSVLKTTASDLILDAPGRRRGGPSPHRRALVHDFQDGLTINFGGDYPGGVTVTGNLAVTGDLKLAGVALGATIASLQSALASIGDLRPRVETMERTVASIVELIGAVISKQTSKKSQKINATACWLQMYPSDIKECYMYIFLLFFLPNGFLSVCSPFSLLFSLSLILIYGII
jgi:hypothetical protein